jgi:hypothetical protein
MRDGEVNDKKRREMREDEVFMIVVGLKQRFCFQWLEHVEELRVEGRK